MPLSLLQILFFLNAAVILGAAICSVTVRSLVHAALWMVLSFFGVAILFVFMGLGFFAVIQVTIYIGAIAVLIIFAIMLTQRSFHDKENSRLKHIWAGIISVSGLFAVLFFTLRLLPDRTTGIPVEAADEIVPNLGRALTEPAQYGLIFELASVLLLAALIGAIYLAFDRKNGAGDKQ